MELFLPRIIISPGFVDKFALDKIMNYSQNLAKFLNPEKSWVDELYLPNCKQGMYTLGKL